MIWRAILERRDVADKPSEVTKIETATDSMAIDDRDHALANRVAVATCLGRILGHPCAPNPLAVLAEVIYWMDDQGITEITDPDVPDSATLKATRRAFVTAAIRFSTAYTQAERHPPSTGQDQG